jgi:hypothetical protein
VREPTVHFPQPVRRVHAAHDARGALHAHAAAAAAARVAREVSQREAIEGADVTLVDVRRARELVDGGGGRWWFG